MCLAFHVSECVFFFEVYNFKNSNTVVQKCKYQTRQCSNKTSPKLKKCRKKLLDQCLFEDLNCQLCGSLRWCRWKQLRFATIICMNEGEAFTFACERSSDSLPIWIWASAEEDFNLSKILQKKSKNVMRLN